MLISLYYVVVSLVFFGGMFYICYQFIAEANLVAFIRREGIDPRSQCVNSTIPTGLIITHEDCLNPGF